MSKYGTIPASSTPTPPEGSSSTSIAESPRATARAAHRRWRELLDPRALSVPRGLADADHRARANLKRFAANYELVLLAVVMASLTLAGRPWYMLIVLPCLIIWPRKSFPAVFVFALVMLLRLDVATESLAISVTVGLLIVVAHAVLQLPTDSGGAGEEAAGPEQPSSEGSDQA